MPKQLQRPDRSS